MDFFLTDYTTDDHGKPVYPTERPEGGSKWDKVLECINGVGARSVHLTQIP